MKKQVVFTSTNKETKAGDTFGVVKPIDKSFVQFVEKKEGYFFTPEQLNELLSNVIKDALDTAAEAQKETCICNQESCVCSDKSNYIMRSITNTFDITFKKHNV